ncbi:hypothetical protein KEM55_001032, partial [Ascosphaera atra]
MPSNTGKPLRPALLSALKSLIGSLDLDFSWQHVTYKTAATLWVLFVFYLSWILLPEVSAIT